MKIKKEHLDFNKDFGLRISDHLNIRILLYFFSSLLIIFCQIVILANLDYSEYRKKQQNLIIEDYKRLVVELITEQGQQITKTDTSASESFYPTIASIKTSSSSADERRQKRKQTDAIMGKQGVLNPKLKSDPIADLPGIGDGNSNSSSDEFVVVELSRKGTNSSMRFQNRSTHKTQYGINIFNEPLDKLYNYVIQRQGDIYINPTDELLGKNKIEFGYRDPDEIQRVIEKYKPMIEHCYRKALDQYGGSRGFVKVQFQISFEGFVIPESIRILNSTIKNRQAEQCIKKYIKRWRNFAELDEAMGIARVTQKFVFN